MNLFDRQEESKNHLVSIKYPLCLIQEKVRRIPILIQCIVQLEQEKILAKGHMK